MKHNDWVRIGLIVAALAVAGCEGTNGDPVVNAPPESRVTGIPPVLEQTDFSVHFYWTGSDPDGEVVYFEWRISDNGSDGVVSEADTMGLPWQRTAVTDSTFVVQADLDSFAIDVADPRQNPRSYRAWQTHTFFLRAVDDAGAVDPTPATVSFTATTLTPTIVIDRPALVTSNTCVQSSRVLTFGWKGTDPDNVTLEPADVRYLLWQIPGNSCLTETDFNRTNPLASVPESAWSPWIPYGAAQDSGKVVTFPRQDLLRKFLFAVQARDVAGAVTPTFEWGVNVRHVEIADTKKPILTVTERFLGSFEFSGSAGLQAFEIVAGQPLEFDWSAVADSYAGIIDAYRYGFEVADINDPNDPGWAVGWGNGPLFTHAGPKSFTQGTPNFVVQVRDNSGTIVRGIFQFDVIQIEQRQNQRDLLLLQDWPHGNTLAELQLARDWDSRWDNLLLGRVVNYDPAIDVLDTYDSPNDFTFRKLNQYKSVLYFCKGSDKTTKFHSVLAPFRSNTGPVLRYNWFEVYQAQVGNVLFVGPSGMFGAIESDPPAWKFPIVFNNADDFGVIKSTDGSQFNGGTLRYPYKAFCLEAIDCVRPNALVYGEVEGASGQRRTVNCDGIARALVDADFLAAYPSAAGEVVDLVYNTDRGQNFTANQAKYQWAREEFYNVNRSTREVSLNLRSCQRIMYKMKARRDDGFVVRPDTTCVPRGNPVSTLNLAPVGIVSTAYSDSKALTGSEDFLWGFHPLGFNSSQVRSSILWVLRERWQLATQ